MPLRLGLVAVVVVVLAHTAHAQRWTHTSCPVDPRKAGIGPLDRRFFGINPDARSVLAPTGGALGYEYVRRLGDSVANETAHAGAITGRVGTDLFHASIAGHAWRHERSDVATSSDTPRMVLGFGVRKLGTYLGGFARYGYGIRYNLGFLGDDDVAGEPPPGGLAALRPFDYVATAIGQPSSITFEARWELAGCYAPFLHLSAAARGRNDAIQESFGMPIAVAVGGYPTSWIGVMLEVAALLARYPDEDSDYNGFGRVRIAVETTLGREHYRVGGAIDQVIGDEIDGLYVHLYLQVAP